MLRRAFVPASCLVSPLILALACGGDPDVANGSGGGFAANAGQGGSSGEGASDAGGNGGEAGTLILPDGGGNGGTGGAPDPCQSVNCPDTQRCEDGACVPNECGDLNCGPQEICEETADGARCKDVSCSEQSSCEQAQYCDPVDGICKDDVCVAGETTCMGDTVLQCDPFGGGEEQLFGCMSGSPYFTSECSDMGSSGQGACTCEDDWDCPRFTDCEAGECQGTGTAPTCALPPADFSSVPPANEITWGGAGVGSENAPADVPFPASAQVVLTPIVANLDDDNGDGAIDERDFPEIIFTTFEGQLNGVHDFTSNGTLRAIHGGGVNKGKDFFANCAGTLWQEGDDPTAVSCNRVDADLDSTASLAVGDLDYDGIPEIVAITENDEVRIYSNRGAIIATAASTGLGGGNPAPTLANLYPPPIGVHRRRIGQTHLEHHSPRPGGGIPIRRRDGRGLGLRLVAGDFIGDAARILALLARDVEDERQVVQLDGISRPHHADRPTDCAELALGDLDGRRVGVFQVESRPQDAPLVRPIDNLESEL